MRESENAGRKSRRRERERLGPVGDKAIKSGVRARERGYARRNEGRKERGRGSECGWERERDSGQGRKVGRSGVAEGCERGTRKGERDAACVGMDQCVNGCCLTRTAEIIVSDPQRILRNTFSATVALYRGGTFVRLAGDGDDSRVPLTNRRRGPFGIA